MKIKSMTATFGRLDRQTLTPGPGLTVISAPNEGGKSTWAGFLRAMLYGVNTRERDKEGYLAEKNRYAPWSGAPMEGELQLTWRGEDITLRRFAKKTSPFGGFEAVYTSSGDPVPGLTADNVGELLVGAGREMYERSAFVGQGGAAIAGGAELEKRIAALATAGEEDVSYSETGRTLKNWLNRRRANRSNGILPQLDESILEAKTAAASLEEARRERDLAQSRLAQLEEEQTALEGELAIHQRLRQQELDKRYAQAKEEWQKALADLPDEKPHPVFGTMTAEEAWAQAQAQVQAKAAAEEENRRRSEERTAKEKALGGQKNAAIGGLVLTAICLALMAVALFNGLWWLAILAAVAGICTVVGVAVCRKKHTTLEGELADLVPVAVPDPGDILEQAAAYRAALAQAAQAKQTAQAKEKLVEELAAQGGRDFTTLEYLQPPARPREETAQRLGWVTAELERTRRTLDVNQGKMNTMGDIDGIYADLDSLSAQRAERQREYDAIEVAMEALSAANNTLRQRFSPALNQRASALFARLTGGQYAALELDRAFQAAVTPAGQVLPRTALALSRGTVEQLYLAVRLAVCELTLAGEEPPPLVLDDALADFDDRRMALALELLKELGAERQILLFTCHSREGAWARENGADVVDLQLASI